MCGDCLHGQCVSNVCVCAPDFTGRGEGIDEQNCHLNEKALNAVWLVCMCICFFVFSTVIFNIAYWLLRNSRSGNQMNQAKLLKYSVFRLKFWGAGASLMYALYAVLRVFAHVRFFDDYPGTVLNVLARIFALGYAANLADIFRNTLVGVLRAQGINDPSVKERSRKLSILERVFAVVVFLPLLGAPSLPSERRSILVRYYMTAFIVALLLFGSSICIAGERTIWLLSKARVEAAKQPIRKIRYFLMMFYVGCFGMFTITVVLVCTSYVIYFPYMLALNNIAVVSMLLPPTLFLHLDASHVNKALPRTGRSLKPQNKQRDSSGHSGANKKAADDRPSSKGTEDDRASTVEMAASSCENPAEAGMQRAESAPSIKPSPSEALGMEQV